MPRKFLSRPHLLRCALFAGLLGLAIAAQPRDASADNGLIEERESIYNNIYVFKRGDQMLMTFGHNRNLYTETVYDTTDEYALPVVYTRYMTAGLAYVKPDERILEIGFGGGRTAWYLHKSFPDLQITSVELDQEVYDLSVKYFGIREEENFEVVIEDGRRFLQKSKEQWPIIMVDAYRGPFVPFHLLTQEFYELTRDRLTEGGVVVQNVEPSTMLFDSALATIGSVFENVDLFPARGNVVMIAYDGPPRTDAALAELAAEIDAERKLKYPLSTILEERQTVRNIPTVDVLTDDFAPVESLKSIEVYNRKLSEITGKADK